MTPTGPVSFPALMMILINYPYNMKNKRCFKTKGLAIV